MSASSPERSPERRTGRRRELIGLLALLLLVGFLHGFWIARQPETRLWGDEEHYLPYAWIDAREGTTSLLPVPFAEWLGCRPPQAKGRTTYDTRVTPRTTYCRRRGTSQRHSRRARGVAARSSEMPTSTCGTTMGPASCQALSMSPESP